MTQNRLHETTSPYLQQHVDNPVHWQPWDAEALALAAQQNKPILLSIGYSACHWCHVMAHESFEDPATAAVMNEHFVNIKVDREERPDLDQIYQLSHQMLTQRGGGWPLTMFLTPDQHIPFFGGTYFPPQAAHGLPGFVDLLGRVSEFYRLHADKIEEQSASIQQVFRDSLPQAGHDEVEFDAAPLHGASRALLGVFDPAWGGFGGAPKFPQSPSIERLLRTWRRSAFAAQPDLQSLFGATHSLQLMARSGLFDQIGGGFYRYCVDHNWRIPHFEKMMYDNAQLLALYSEAWRATGDGIFGRTAHATADWMLREMRSPEHGFYTAIDADSEGHEGKYYVWTPDEVREIVGEEHYAPIATRWGLDQDANFEGKWHLYNAKPVAEVAAQFEIEINELQDQLGAAQTALYSQREKRVRPLCDTKCLTSSNALAIRGLAIAARHLEREDLLEAAEETLNFVINHLWVEQRLRTTYSQGEARLNGYLHDYAYLLDAIIELLQSRWNSEFLAFAQQLAEVILEQFYDAQDGGFFFTSDDHEALLQRMKPLTDDASPSANGVAARALNRLGHLLGEPRYLDASKRTLELAWPALNSVPHAHCALLDALEEQLESMTCVVIRAPRDDVAQWLPVANATYAPGRLCVGIPDDAKNLPEALAVRAPREGGVAYICHGTECSAPITTAARLSSEIKALN